MEGRAAARPDGVLWIEHLSKADYKVVDASPAGSRRKTTIPDTLLRVHSYDYHVDLQRRQRPVSGRMLLYVRKDREGMFGGAKWMELNFAKGRASSAVAEPPEADKVSRS